MIVKTLNNIGDGYITVFLDTELLNYKLGWFYGSLCFRY